MKKAFFTFITRIKLQKLLFLNIFKFFVASKKG